MQESLGAETDSKTKCIEFYHKIDRGAVDFPPCKSPAELPDIFVYLHRHGKNVCYVRCRPADPVWL
jgi:hypothetical protein